MPNGFHHVASPGLAFRADHRRTFRESPQSLTEVAASAHEGNVEFALVDVVVLIRNRENLNRKILEFEISNTSTKNAPTAKNTYGYR